MENQKVTFIEFLGSIISLLVDQKKIIIVSLILSFLASIFFYFTTSKVYESSFTVSTEIISETSIKNRFNSLVELTKKTSNKAVSNRLEISEEAAEALKSIECEFSSEEITSVLDLETNHALIATFTVQSAESKYFQDYQSAFINFLGSGPAIQEKLTQTKSSLEALQFRYSKLLADSSSSNKLNISVEGMPSEKAYLAQQLERVNIQLNNFEAVKLVNEVITPEKATNKNVIRAAGAFVLINILGVFIAILSQAWPDRA